MNWMPRSLCWVYMLLVCCFVNINAIAQSDFHIENFTSEHGLSQGVVRDILQDREGFLWFATKDGLNRYDGYEFKVFTNDPNNAWSISGNTIEMLFEDSKGRIWATSNNSGINIYDKATGRFHHFAHDPQNPAGLTGNFISYIVEDTSGYFIVGVNERELNMFQLKDEFFTDQETPSVIRVQMPRQNNLINSLHSELRGLVKDSKGRIWVGVHDAIYRLDVQKAQLNVAYEGNSIGISHTNNDGTIWSCGEYTNLFNWDGEQVTSFDNTLKGGIDIRVDTKENIWFSRVDSLYGLEIVTSEEGSKEKRKSFNKIYSWSPPNVSNDYPLKSMSIDNSGIVWSGTNGYGLYKTNPKFLRFSHLKKGKSIRCIVTLPDGDILTRDYNYRWYSKNNNKQIISDFFSGGKNSSIIDNMIVSNSGDYFIRKPSLITGSILYKYNPKNKTKRSYAISWHHYDDQPMIECRDGKIWMAGVNDVLSYLDTINGEFKSYSLIDGELIESPENNKRFTNRDLSTALYEDNSGVIWVGTMEGFTKCIRSASSKQNLSITKFKNIPNDIKSLSYNHVLSFLDDPISPEKYLWITTKGGGINYFNKETHEFKRITVDDGLPDNVVYGLLVDDDNNLWGSTNKGIFCLIVDRESNKDDELQFMIRSFSKTDGLQENEFNTAAFVKSNDGRLIFGGINGYNIFDPKEILSTEFTPPVYITKLLINNIEVSPYDNTNILSNTIETTKSISLNYSHSIITLEFASLDFTAPKKNKYRYQLVGKNDNWIESGTHRSATFLNLQPKKYTFRIQATNSQGVWSDKIAELDILVSPPWWKTWWAYLIYLLAIIALIASYFRFSIKRAKLSQQLDFEKRESDRVRELDALKSQLFTNMTHEFRTPLTIILGMAKQVMDNPKDHFQSGMQMIVRNGQNLLGLVNKMLSLSKLENGKMELELIKADVVSFLRNIVDSFKSFAVNKEIQLHFLSDIDREVMDFDDDKLHQVVNNLLSNAFKFTPNGGHVYFSIRSENGFLTIRVKDTGKGIAIQDVPKVFDRFYQVDNSSTRQYEGTGIGLALSKELVKLMGGAISVQSPPVGAKIGTEFTVTLPIKKDDYIKVGKPLEITENANVMEMKNRKAPLTSIDNAEKKVKVEQKSPLNKPIKHKEKPLVLIVEDNEDVASYISACLPDYNLVLAENGQVGFEVATDKIPDLIISDVMMPVMDGFELCRKLKEDNRTDHIPVVMLTARADFDSKMEGLEKGANAYLPKPFEKKELLLVIRNIFELRDKIRFGYQMKIINDAPIESQEASIEETKEEDPFVTNVKINIEENLENFDYNVEMLAKNMHLSHSQFGRKLDALTGFSPNQFIRFVRLNKAKELLKKNEISITTISYDCGFKDPSYFSRVFKKEFGATPNEWREQHS